MPNPPDPIDPDVDLHVPAQRQELHLPFVALVSLGGGLGGVARYGLSSFVPGAWGLFVINVLGSFFIGVLMGVVPRPLVRAFFGVGLLGGFTTFSSYALSWSVFLWLTPVCAVLAAFLGLRVTR
ncbi:CrcB family protein [Lentzea sp. BCCO 10_0856]|uniref:Fluoride-specific ion channel FluC n=1 Tax=Lentzea miocenica TaxID=3095431 RepID=A0ABU4TAQ1_9PSEU|nr:CrcB family protein [Lentzea sp. BCCO 10_0856]MDX8034988.1 CrcB family protein [Lentzea sp. BCCO 10_0856]